MTVLPAARCESEDSTALDPGVGAKRCGVDRQPSRDGLRVWRTAGVDTVRLYPAGETLHVRLDTLARAIELVREGRHDVMCRCRGPADRITRAARTTPACDVRDAEEVRIVVSLGRPESDSRGVLSVAHDIVADRLTRSVLLQRKAVPAIPGRPFHPAVSVSGRARRTADSGGRSLSAP